MNRRIAAGMRRPLAFCRWEFLVCVSVRSVRSRAWRCDIRYGPDSIRQEGVPRGEVTTHEWKDSKVFPGTIRRYYVYVPAQYDRNEAGRADGVSGRPHVSSTKMATSASRSCSTI